MPTRESSAVRDLLVGLTVAAAVSLPLYYITIRGVLWIWSMWSRLLL